MITLNDVIPMCLAVRFLGLKSNKQIYRWLQYGDLAWSCRIGGTRFLLRGEVEALANGRSLPDYKDQPIPLDSLMSGLELSEALKIDHNALWRRSDYRGGDLVTVQFNDEVGRFWLRSNADGR